VASGTSWRSSPPSFTKIRIGPSGLANILLAEISRPSGVHSTDSISCGEVFEPETSIRMPDPSAVATAMPSKVTKAISEP